MAIFCFNPRYADEMNAFIGRVADKIGDGVRPAIDLGSQAVAKLLDDKDWMPSDTMPLPQKKVGMAVLKDHRTMSEKMIEQGRAGNKGCYFISIVFIVVVVVAVALALFNWLA